MSSTAAPSTLPTRAQRVALFYRDLVGKKFAMALERGRPLRLRHRPHGRQPPGLPRPAEAQRLCGLPPRDALAALGTRVVLPHLRRRPLLYRHVARAEHSRAARPVRYQVQRPAAPEHRRAHNGAERRRRRPAFIVYHLLHLTTWRRAPRASCRSTPYDNVVRGFQVRPRGDCLSSWRCACLGLHLYHGAWSMFQSVGLSHPRYTPALRKFAAASSIVLVIGFSSIPLAVLFGVVR